MLEFLFFLLLENKIKLSHLKECQTNSSSFLFFQHNFPRTLEALIVHLLSPVGAEVLTRKFDDMDQQITEEDRYLLISQLLFT